MSLKKPKFTPKDTENVQSLNTLDKYIRIEAQSTPLKQQKQILEIEYKNETKTQKKKREEDFNAYLS